MSVVDISEPRQTKERGASFTARKLQVVARALNDQRLTHLDFRLFYYLADATDSQTGIAKRKQQTIADALGVTRRAVQIGIDRLVMSGYLRRETKSGGTYVNAYRRALENANEGSSFSNRDANEGSYSEAKMRTRWTEKANEITEKGERSFAPILPSNSHLIPSRVRGPSSTEVFGRAGVMLRQLVGNDVFVSWFGKALIASETEETVTINVPTTFIRDYIRAQFGPQMMDAWRSVNPQIERITVSVM